VASLRARSAPQTKPGSFGHDREVCTRLARCMIRDGKLSTTLCVIAASLAVVLVIGLSPRPSLSLPLYARQTGQPCTTCHTAFLEVTPFGRRFKLGGYTLGGGELDRPAVCGDARGTDLYPHRGRTTVTASDRGRSAHQAVAQAQQYIAAKAAPLPISTPTTIRVPTGEPLYRWQIHRQSRRVHPRDIRRDHPPFQRGHNSINVDGHNLLWGITANNNPTVQDVWNTIPAWSFPYISSALAPMPSAKTFIDQVYAQQVVGLSGYGFVYDLFYLEFGGYRPLSTKTQLALGIDTTGQSPISCVAPYWRVAIEPNFGDHSWEVGTFGLASKVFPMGLSGAGTDSFTDVGIDTQYQYLGDPHTVTARVAWIHENHNASASPRPRRQFQQPAASPERFALLYL